MTEVGPSSHAQGIADLFSEYQRAVAAADADAWEACWSPDAPSWILNMGEGLIRITGRSQIVARWAARMKEFSSVNIAQSITEICEASDDMALVKSATREEQRHADGSGTIAVGSYSDRVVRIGSKWLFAERSFQLHTRTVS